MEKTICIFFWITATTMEINICIFFFLFWSAVINGRRGAAVNGRRGAAHAGASIGVVALVVLSHAPRRPLTPPAPVPVRAA